MLAWLRNHFCAHCWELVETDPIHLDKTEIPYFIVNYRCSRGGKTRTKYLS